MNDEPGNSLDELAEEFVARLRRGERPKIAEYAARAPAHADEIRDLFPALRIMEHAGPGLDSFEAPAFVAGASPTPPTHLGDYRIIREVGRGGMGVVYEAEQVTLGRHVALKVLPDRASQNPKNLLRFRREARSAGRLHHTNIVPVFDIGCESGVHYYAMQFIQGNSLDAVIAELARLQMLDANRPTATADAAMHSAGNMDLSGRIAQDLLTRRWPAEIPRPMRPLSTERWKNGRSAMVTVPHNLPQRLTKSLTKTERDPRGLNGLQAWRVSAVPPTIPLR